MTTIANGPPGIEVPHVWNSALTFNNLAERPARIKLTKLTGWGSLGDIEPGSAPYTSRGGERPLQSYVRGRTVVYEGVIQSKTLDGLRAKGNALKGAFWDTRAEKTMLLDSPAGQDWLYNARCTQLDMDDEQLNGREFVFPFTRAFQLGLRQSDPRVYAWPTPVALGPTTGAQNVTNSGTRDTPPTFGATVSLGNDVRLINNTTGLSVRFIDLPAGTLAVNFLTRTAMVGSVDVSGLLDLEDFSWWGDNAPGIIPGVNNVNVTGATNWSIGFFHAC